jgi:hypothetical protein
VKKLILAVVPWFAPRLLKNARKQMRLAALEYRRTHESKDLFAALAFRNISLVAHYAMLSMFGGKRRY